MHKAVAYFANNGIFFDTLAAELRYDFSEEHCVSVNDDKNATQRTLLARYVKGHCSRNVKVFVDGGISDGTFNGQGFREIFKLIESDQVQTLTIKDMSRLGRNYIEVGQLTDY